MVIFSRGGFEQAASLFAGRCQKLLRLQIAQR